LGLHRMAKLAHAKAEEIDLKRTAELDFEIDKGDLKKKKEDEIRVRLDEFAKELARVSKQRK